MRPYLPRQDDEESGAIPYEDVPEFDDAFPPDEATQPGQQDMSEPWSDAPPPVPPPEPNAVPAELRADFSPDVRKQALDAALAKDKKAQDRDDLSAMLLAAGRREAPHLRSLGNPNFSAALHEYPDSKRVLKAVTAKPANPLDEQIKTLHAALMQKSLNAPPKAAPGGEKYASDAEAEQLDAKFGHLYPSGHLPRDEQGRLNWRVVPLANSETNSIVSGGVKQQVAAAGRAQGERHFQDQQQQELQGMEIPGYRRDPGVRVDTTEARQLRDATSEAEAIGRDTAKLEQLVSKNGLEFSPGSPVKAEMEGALKDLQLRLKGGAAYQLGVLSGPDMAILESITGDPTALNLRNVFGGKDVALARIRGVKERAQSGLDAKMKSRGYSRGAAPAKTKTRTLVNNKTGERLPGVTPEQMEVLRKEPDFGEYVWEEDQ